MKANHYLDSFVKDQATIQKITEGTTKNSSLIDQPVLDDFEFSANPQKYLDEIETTLKKHRDLSQNFQRFIQKVFEDTEQEQILTDFITRNPQAHGIYMDLAMRYNYFH